MFARYRRTSSILLFVVAFTAETALAEDHRHHHEAGASAQLTLDNGKKWATDGSLRQGMEHIRGALTANLHAIHSGKATTEQYQALAQKINDQIAFMIKNCKLGTKADAMLHLVLADIIAGADAMMSPSSDAAHQGAAKVVRALENYGAYFDHPGWQAAKAAH